MLLAGLPLREFPAKKSGDTIAIILTGDGGWRRIDDRLTRNLNAHGVSVVGFLTPDYFHERRTPLESARALERTIRSYQLLWHRPRVILIGYSRGADVLPAMISRLPPSLQARTRMVALLGASPKVEFEFHVSDWMRSTSKSGYEVKPEIEKLTAQRILCLSGEDDKDSLCRMLSGPRISVVILKGSHHFDGGYEKLANIILAHLQ